MEIFTDKGISGTSLKRHDESISRFARNTVEFHKMLNAISVNTVENFDEAKATKLMNEKSRLKQQLAQYADVQQKRENAKSRLDEIYTILDGFKNHPLTYDDQIIRQILECVVVESKEKIKINPPAMPGDCTLIYILSLKNDTVKNIYTTITI